MRKLSIMKCIAFLLFILSTFFGFSQTTVNVTVTGTWTCPDGVTSVNVGVWGGGGGGGYGGGSNDDGGGGGGGGGYTSQTGITVVPGTVYNVTVSSGGAGGTVSSTTGQAGGSSTVVFGAVTVTAGGGGGGQGYAAGAAGGAAGAGSTYNGGAGGNGSGTSSGGGGEGACATSTGQSGSGSTAGTSTCGANGGAGITTQSDPGNPGSAPGGGASGGTKTSNGGAGARGQVSITFTCPTPAVTAAAAGPDQTLAACATTATLAGNAPVYGDGTWTCVSGCTGVTFGDATSPTSTVSGITPGSATTLRWTITNGGCGSTQDDVVITGVIGAGCWTYCSVSGNTNCSAGPTSITNVTFNTINNTTACAAGGYINTGLTTSVTQALAYTIYVTISATYGGDVGVWFDWNNDGDFADTGEFTKIVNNAAGGSTSSISITVPADAVVGNTRMRVRYMYSTPDLTSGLYCTSGGTYGETEDYTINVVASADCAGTPDPGTAAISSASGCPSPTSLTLSTSGYDLASGLTYQWQKSTDGGTTWASQGVSSDNAPTTPLSVTPTETTMYRLQVYCALSATYDYSNQVTYTATLVATCYCTPTGNLNCTGSNSYISNVTFNTINRNSTCDAGGYTRTGVSSTVSVGTTYTLSVTNGSAATGRAEAFFDWNGDGDFADAGEYKLISSSMAGNSTASVSVAIPSGGATGTIGMRIRYFYSTSAASTTYCTSSGTYGETEDYLLNVAIPSGTCSDGIQNQDETAVDCGGTICVGCGGTCFDGIWNNGETDVDCGGSCGLPCVDQTGIVSQATCPASDLGTVYRVYCDQIGTDAYDYASPQATVSSTAATLPSPAPTCAEANTTTGGWVRFELASGVTQMNFNFNGGSMASGNSTVYTAVYQGNDCASLNFLSCHQVESFSSSGYYIYNVSISGLDDTKDLWMYFFNQNNKAFSLSFDFIGTGSAPINTSTAAQATYATTCPTTLPATGDACNLGAPGATLTTPYYGGESCTGGGWSTNENTTFYSFTASATVGTLEIGDIVCNDGSASSGAQFGVWSSCGSIGTYGADFLGCAVGTGAVSLTGLTIGQTYYIAADGTAGNNCRWTYSGSAVEVVLPIELSNLSASIQKNNTVRLDWITASEKNNDYFTIERSIDGVHFEELMKIKGAGNSNKPTGYTEYDSNPYQGTSYYRLKQTDFDGKSTYSKMVSVNVSSTYGNVSIVPNPVRGAGYINFSSEEEIEVVLSVYSASGVLMEAKPMLVKEGTNSIELPTEQLTKGMYFVRMESAGGENITRKFVKE